MGSGVPVSLARTADVVQRFTFLTCGGLDHEHLSILFSLLLCFINSRPMLKGQLCVTSHFQLQVPQYLLLLHPIQSITLKSCQR